MSRRFGRNQRRAARQALATSQQQLNNAQVALAMDRSLLVDQGRRLRQLQDEMEDARRIAGQMSILFPAGRMQLSGPRRDSIQVCAIPPPRPWELTHDRGDSAMEFSYAARDQRLSVMLGRIDADALRGAVHVRVDFGDHHSGYAISPSAIASEPGDVLAERILEQLSFSMGDRLKLALEK